MMKKGFVLFGMLLCIIILLLAGSATAASSGTYCGVSWSLTDAGVLTLGNGDTQTMRASGGTKWNASDVTSVTCSGTIVVNSGSELFRSHSSMRSADLSGFDVSRVTNMSDMFYGCERLSSLTVSGWNTGNVTTMKEMFRGCSALLVDFVSGFDTSNVTDMSFMFYNCDRITSLDLSGWDVSHVTTMASMFYHCDRLTALNMSGWNTSSLTSTDYMFGGCYSIQSLDLSELDTNNVTNMAGMFINCNRLTSLDVSGWDTSNLTNVTEMFRLCTRLPSVDFSDWDTSHLTNTTRMFAGCQSLTSAMLSSLDTSHVTDMTGMFLECKNLVSLDFSVLDTSNVTNMSYMFSGCTDLAGIDFSSLDTSRVMNMSYMFQRCQNLASVDFSTLNTSNVTDMSGMFSDCSNIASLDLSELDTHNVTTMAYMFKNCSVTELILSGWDMSHVANMYQMFYGCQNLESLDLSNVDLHNLTSMEYMFANCVISKVNLSGLNVSNVLSMAHMFDSASITELNLANWDARNVTNMNSMFYNCKNLTSLDLSSWDMSNGIQVSYMFAGCSMETLNLSGWQWGEATELYYMFENGNFKILDLSGWDTSKVTSFNGMFYRCVLECDLDLSQWNVSKITNLYYMFQDCTIPKVNMYGWQLDSVEGVTYIFYRSNIEFLDVRDWNFLKATDLRYLVDDGTFGTILITGWHLPKLKYGYGLLQRINVKELDVTGWVFGDAPQSVTGLFNNSPNLEVLNLFDWDLKTLIGTSGSLGGWFNGCNSLRQVQLGTEWAFKGVNRNGYPSETGSLPSNYFTKDGVSYMGRWVHVNGRYGPYYSSDLADIWTGDFSGTWIREEVSNNCYIRFRSTLDGTRGEMDQVTYDYREILQLPASNFRKEGYGFVGWTDGKGNQYVDEDVIPAERYTHNEIVTLTAVWTTKYTLNFVSSDPDAVGAMNSVSAEATMAYTIPANQFVLEGTPFVCWMDDIGHVYFDGEQIAANTYAPGDDITLMAMFIDPRYTVCFQSGLDSVVGEMANVFVVYSYDYVLPECGYKTVGAVFDHWEDEAGNVYAELDVIPGGTYAPGDVVTFTAIFEKLHYPLEMNDGEFTFSIKRDETAVFDSIPAGTSYQVYEQTPRGWVLVQRVNPAGTIEALEKFEARFLNQYDPEKVVVQFTGLKLMDGTPAEAGEFVFELWSEDGYIQSVTVDAGGLVQFDPLEFTQDDVGEHLYTIKERMGVNNGIIYDDHEDVVKVTVYEDGSNVTVYAHTDNIGDDGNKIDIVDHSRDGEVQTIYVHTDNIDDDGNKLSDYVSNQRYSKIVTIPGAVKLHVKLKYTNARGPFYVWAGSHNEVFTESFSATCNTNVSNASNAGGYLRYFVYQSGKDQEYLYDEFDIPGDSLSIWYYSYAYDASQGYYPNGPYSDMVNYGYYMEVTADTYLKEEYANSTRADGAAWNDYESGKYYTQVVTIPDVEKLHVRLKYTNPRGMFYIWKGAHPVEIETRRYTADCNLDPLSASNPGGYYKSYTYQDDMDQEYLTDVFEVDDDSISILYESYAYPMVYSSYSDVINYGYYMTISDTALAALVETDEDGIKFENTSKPGTLILQKLGSDDVVYDGTFYYEVQFFTAGGMTYELPDSTIIYEQRDGIAQDFPDLNVLEKPVYNLTVNMVKLSADGDPVVVAETRQYHADDIYSIYPLQGLVVSEITGADVVQTQSGWRGVMPSEDTVVNVYYSQPITVTGSIVWLDDDNVEGRPESVVVHLMKDDMSLAYQSVTSDNDWNFTFEDYPAFDGNGRINYQVLNEEIMNYKTSIDGTIIKVSAPVATISKSLWTSKINSLGAESDAPLRHAHSLNKNTTYEAVAELPENKIKIDDDTTACSIYFWKDGDDCYWWSDAQTVYFPVDASNMFESCSSLTFVDIAEWNTSKVTSLYCMFYECNSLVSLDVSRWDTSNVTNMTALFYRCNNVASLDVSGFDTHNVTSMRAMFNGCSSIISLDVSGFDTSNVTDMGYMFVCEELRFVDVSEFNTSHVTTMEGMFYNCSSLTSLNLSGWDTSNVTSMHSMFYQCSGLTSLNVTGFDTSNVVDMSSMFSACSGLVSLDLSGFDPCNVTSMNYMFKNCRGLTSLDLSGWDTGKLTSMYQMFQYCSGLITLNVSGWDTSKVLGMEHAFYACRSLTTLDLSDWNTSNVKWMNYMFYGCQSLNTIYIGSGWYMADNTTEWLVLCPAEFVMK